MHYEHSSVRHSTSRLSKHTPIVLESKKKIYGSLLESKIKNRRASRKRSATLSEIGHLRRSEEEIFRGIYWRALTLFDHNYAHVLVQTRKTNSRSTPSRKHVIRTWQFCAVTAGRESESAHLLTEVLRTTSPSESRTYAARCFRKTRAW